MHAHRICCGMQRWVCRAGGDAGSSMPTCCTRPPARSHQHPPTCSSFQMVVVSTTCCPCSQPLTDSCRMREEAPALAVCRRGPAGDRGGSGARGDDRARGAPRLDAVRLRGLGGLQAEAALPAWRTKSAGVLHRRQREAHLCQACPGGCKQLAVQVQLPALAHRDALQASQSAAMLLTHRQQARAAQRQAEQRWQCWKCLLGSAVWCVHAQAAATQAPFRRHPPPSTATHHVKRVDARHGAEGEGEAGGEAAVGAAGAQGAAHYDGPHINEHVLVSKDELQAGQAQQTEGSQPARIREQGRRQGHRQAGGDGSTE